MNKVVRGFTIIEILITLVVMAGLLSLGVAAVGSMQVQARDKERETDIQTIARGLEARYSNGNVIASTANASQATITPGTYPGNWEMFHARGDDLTAQGGWTPAFVPGGYYTSLLKGVTSANLISPSGQPFDLLCVWACAPATDATQASNAVGVVGADKYIYAPVDAAGNVCCCGNCVSYILYWREEATGAIKSLKGERR